MKIKMIELLTRIANEKDIPKLMEYKGKRYYWVEGEHTKGYRYKSLYWLCNQHANYDEPDFLNEEVEILEEDKPIESINAYNLLESPYLVGLLNQQRYDEFMEHLKQSELEIVDKISKVIDEINKMKGKENGKNN